MSDTEESSSSEAPAQQQTEAEVSGPMDPELVGDETMKSENVGCLGSTKRLTPRVGNLRRRSS